MVVVEDLKKETRTTRRDLRVLVLSTHTHTFCFALPSRALITQQHVTEQYTTTAYSSVCLLKKKGKKKWFELRGTNVLTGRAAHTTRMRNVTSMGGSRGGKTYKQTNRERRDDYTTWYNVTVN